MKKGTFWKQATFYVFMIAVGGSIPLLPELLSQPLRLSSQKLAERDFHYYYAKGDTRFRAMTLCFTCFPGLQCRTEKEANAIDRQGFINFYSGNGVPSTYESLVNDHKAAYAEKYNQLLLRALREKWKREHIHTSALKDPLANL